MKTIIRIALAAVVLISASCVHGWVPPPPVPPHPHDVPHPHHLPTPPYLPHP